MSKVTGKIGLTVILSTREADLEYCKHIQKTSGLGDKIQIIACVNNGEKSLSQVYNEQSKAAYYKFQAFVHDDLIFETLDWGKKLLRHFLTTNFSIIGVAGVREELPASGCWWANGKNTVGIVNHMNSGLKYETAFSPDQGSKVEPVIVLDGLFIAVNKNIVEREWDESFTGFHFYDLGFTFPCYLDGYDIGVVTDIRLTHKSVGHTNEKWEDARKLFVEKYQEELPFTQQS